MRWLARGESHLPPEGGWLGPFETARAGTMRFTKRRTEYLVARWTAKHALAHAIGLAGDLDLGTLARLEVRNAPTGAPEAYLDGAPLDLPLSLTDRAGWAVCLVNPGASAVGIDLEIVEPRTPGFVRDFLTVDEQRLVAAAADDDGRHLAANLLWSAKESALKVLRTGLRRDTRSVEVSVSFDQTAAGWAPLSVRSVEGGHMPGWWRRYGVFILTVASAAPAPPPITIEEPPTLVSAQPMHTWLGRPV
jgi:4'-phosphopantetheinyl transferase